MAEKFPVLSPLPKPLTLFSGYEAKKQETFVMKENSEHLSRDGRLVSFIDIQTGRPGEPFIEIEQLNSDFGFSIDSAFVFRDVKTGGEILQIEKEEHSFHADIFRATAMGREFWSLTVTERFINEPEFELKVNLENGESLDLQVPTYVADQKRGIVLDGQPIATIDRYERFKHVSREDIIHVASGFDILLAIGVLFCHTNKDEEKKHRRRT